MKEQEKRCQWQEGKETCLDAIRGCLIGGAAGDAQSYPVEFLEWGEICRRYGVQGITEYQLDSKNGKALISDDMQMTLFAAYGILRGATDKVLGKMAEPLETYVQKAYLDWLTTQTGKTLQSGHNWLADIPALNKSRAPGTACMAALTQRHPVEDSKGCGGVMRVAPVALYFKQYSTEVPLTGAWVAAITHGHPLGYMSAALVYILHGVVYKGQDGRQPLRDPVDACCGMLEELYYNMKKNLQ